MHCNQEQIEALLDGELVGPEQDAVLTHLRDCPGCRSYYRQLLAMEQALRADAGNMLLETYQRRLHYNDNDEGQDVGLELAKRARLEKYMQREVIIAQRQELFRLRRAHNISDITFYEVLREIDLKEESLR